MTIWLCKWCSANEIKISMKTITIDQTQTNFTIGNNWREPSSRQLQQQKRRKSLGLIFMLFSPILKFTSCWFIPLCPHSRFQSTLKANNNETSKPVYGASNLLKYFNTCVVVWPAPGVLLWKLQTTGLVSIRSQRLTKTQSKWVEELEKHWY